ncbi:MAG: hypothetical protein L3J04_06835, partial [Robiginitomaculum sp.]|nr:hypothetical protein [Robiginitomaculum sp.]
EGEVAVAHSLYKDALALNPEQVSMQNSLANIYMGVGLYGEVPAVSSQLADRMTALWMSGQKQQSLKLVRDTLQADSLQSNWIGHNLGYVLYVTGDVKGAYPHMRKFVTDFNILEQAVRPSSAGFYATFAFVLQKNGDRDADILIRKLETYLGEGKAGQAKTGADKNLRTDLRPGIILQMIKGDKDAAYTWLDRFLDLDFSDTVLLTTPPFEPMRGTPEFEKRATRMAENAAKHRALIEAQLSSPKPNWVNK